MSAIKAWGSKSVWALIDQALFAGSNLLANLVLARSLTPEGFGLYAFGFSAFLFVGNLHNPLIMEPMLVFGATRHKEDFQPYLRTLLWIHWLFTSVLSLAVLGGVFCLGYASTHDTTMTVALIAAPAMLFSWLVRRACYVTSVPRTAALGGAAYLALLAGGLFALRSAGMLSVTSAFGLMGVVSIPAGALILPRPPKPRIEKPPWQSVATEHWMYGRWALLASAACWIPANWYYVVLPGKLGLSAAGYFKALTVMIAPAAQVTAAAGLLLLPKLARERHDHRRFTRSVAMALALLISITMLYWCVLGLFPSQLATALFGPNWHFEKRHLILLGLFPCLAAIASVLGAALRAREELRAVTLSHVGAAMLTVTIGTPLLTRYGIDGAIYGLLLSSLVPAILLGASLFHLRYRTGVDCG
jgi:O-antigen/teichoic acid export membrane protein